MNELARHYTKFKVSERVLLTGHSHQAWPDCAFDGQAEAWLDAADLVDAKWGKAFEKAAEVQAGFARMMGDTTGLYTLAPSTHDLIVRWLSALPLKSKPRIVTTDSEFHSLRRQLLRLQEEGVEIVTVAAHPVATLAERMIAAVDEQTAAVMMSLVFFNSGQIVKDASAINGACEKLGVPFLLDVYHALNVVDFDLRGLESAYIVGGGYKYCQMGEGNCFLRFPKDCQLRPVITGWMADFGALEKTQDGKTRTGYGEGGARFAGSTYDPVSQYRAASVLEFFKRESLSPRRLREISQTQIKLLASEFDALNFPPKVIERDRSIPLENIGGFLALITPNAKEISEGMKARGVLTDYRGNVLRLGPAPYLTDEQLKYGILTLSEVARGLK